VPLHRLAEPRCGQVKKKKMKIGYGSIQGFTHKNLESNKQDLSWSCAAFFAAHPGRYGKDSTKSDLKAYNHREFIVEGRSYSTQNHTVVHSRSCERPEKHQKPLR
jgi:hypothetical protein